MHDVKPMRVYIARPPAEVYEFASAPKDLLQRTSSFSGDGLNSGMT